MNDTPARSAAPAVTGVTPATSSAESAGADATTGAPGRPRSGRWTTPLRALALSGAVAIVVAALAVPRWSPASSPENAADDQHASSNQLGVAATALPLASAAVSAPSASKAVSAPEKKTLEPKREKPHAAESANVAAAIAMTAATIEASENAEPATSPADPEPEPSVSAAATEAAAFPSVTITGCLETSGDETEFRLTGTEGADAPKSRSWRTAFLKKRTAPVALVEPPDQHPLQMEVGKRVAATGLLTGRSLTVNSLRVIAPSCN
jgi:hypothetical protein